jgi:S1-C subfamily serine protease
MDSNIFNFKNLFLAFILLGLNTSLMANGPSIFNSKVDGVALIMGDGGLASGAIISSKGHILTNWHAVDGNENMEIIILGEGEIKDNTYQVEVLKLSQSQDLALLKIINPPRDLNVLKLSKVIPKIGSTVHAIGHPEGEVWSYSLGYISQHRDDYEWSYKDSDESFTADVYQMQTPINEGNSGGPLLNKYGNIIGINSFGYEASQGLNYAVTVKEIIKFLVY